MKQINIMYPSKTLTLEYPYIKELLGISCIEINEKKELLRAIDLGLLLRGEGGCNHIYRHFSNTNIERVNGRVDGTSTLSGNKLASDK